VAVLAALDAAHVPNMLVGSMASNFHGIPRSTRDADFVVELHADSLQRLEAQLPPRNMLAIRGRELDWAYIDRWTAAHDTNQLLAEIRASVPPV